VVEEVCCEDRVGLFGLQMLVMMTMTTMYDDRQSQPFRGKISGKTASSDNDVSVSRFRFPCGVIEALLCSSEPSRFMIKNE
jgi:hypothetical protein